MCCGDPSITDHFRGRTALAVLLKPKPSERWLLVTEAFHMPRAIGRFRAAGFQVERIQQHFRTGGSSHSFPPYAGASRHVTLHGSCATRAAKVHALPNPATTRPDFHRISSLPARVGYPFPVAQPGDRRDHLRYKAAGERQNAPNPLEAFQGLPAGLGSGPSRGEECNE